jgi:hypothetical protein
MEHDACKDIVNWNMMHVQTVNWNLMHVKSRRLQRGCELDNWHGHFYQGAMSMLDGDISNTLPHFESNTPNTCPQVLTN